MVKRGLNIRPLKQKTPGGMILTHGRLYRGVNSTGREDLFAARREAASGRQGGEIGRRARNGFQYVTAFTSVNR